MSRIPNKVEVIRERDEGELGCLGNARVYVRLVRMRVWLASRRQRELLLPALEDLELLDALLRKVQSQIKEREEKRNEN